MSPITQLQVNVIRTYLECQFSNYPFDADKDVAYFARLIDEFCELDVFDELKQYHAWSLDQPEGKKIAYRSRFRTWLKTALNYKRQPLYRPFWMRRSC